MTRQFLRKGQVLVPVYRNIILWIVLVVLGLVAYGVGLKLGKEAKLRRERPLSEPSNIQGHTESR
jgi:hypothetical protein